MLKPIIRLILGVDRGYLYKRVAKKALSSIYLRLDMMGNINYSRLMPIPLEYVCRILVAKWFIKRKENKGGKAKIKRFGRTENKRRGEEE